MSCIFPPSGNQDAARFSAVANDERGYMWFCLEFCDSILARHPRHLGALEIAANHYTALGYYEDGLRLDQRLVALKPDDPGIRYNYACSLALVGRKEEALAELSGAVAKGYRDYRHMSTDRDLKSLRDDPRFGQLLTRVTDLETHKKT